METPNPVKPGSEPLVEIPEDAPHVPELPPLGDPPPQQGET